MTSSIPVPGPNKKPTVIGLYGISGCGKSFLLASLKKNLSHEAFDFFEGSEVISDLVDGGLNSFKDFSEPIKATWRSMAILRVQEKCQQSGRTGVVAGHYMFWPENQSKGQDVHTAEDLTVFTHIVYVAVDPELISQYRVTDQSKQRPRTCSTHLGRWQRAEVDGLRELCRDHRILFMVWDHPHDVKRLSTLFRHFRDDTEERNWHRITQQIDDCLLAKPLLQTMLVLDADKTLAEEDAGALFWRVLRKTRAQDQDQVKFPLKEIFGGPLGYSDCAFRQAALLYEEAATDEEYETLCEKVALSIILHDDITTLIQLAAASDLVGLVVVTSGLRRVWEKVIDREGLSNAVSIIGGGRTSDAMLVTGSLKARIVSQLRKQHGLRVWAFGDSPLDIPMLVKADEAIVVVGKEETRSQSMGALVLEKINQGVLQPRQTLLPGHVTPLLDDTLMPRAWLGDRDFIKSITHHSPYEDRAKFESSHSNRALEVSGLPASDLKVLHATDKCAAKLLMSPTRDASIAGPALRAAHFAVGKYLATEYISEEIGLEGYPISHVQGHQTHGYRLQGEAKTTIIALMRGGEAMALGVNEAFPTAMFVHAFTPSDLEKHHLQNQDHVILVDSVINSGKTIREFVEQIQQLHWKGSVLALTGVIQAGAVSNLEDLAGQVSLIALRISENKFVGTKTTDTGNRLCNTTHLD